LTPIAKKSPLKPRIAAVPIVTRPPARRITPLRAEIAMIVKAVLKGLTIEQPHVSTIT
jgi:hypothetical protein